MLVVPIGLGVSDLNKNDTIQIYLESFLPLLRVDYLSNLVRSYKEKP